MKFKEFVTPIGERYFEDYEADCTYDCGQRLVLESEIIEFAQRYDPQPFHVDPVEAVRSIYGGLIASGWHTGALTMRLLVENYVSTVASLGSPGIETLRWPAPVRPGDTLTVTVEVLEARVSRSKPDRGIVRSEVRTSNQKGVQVMGLVSANFFLRRSTHE